MAYITAPDLWDPAVESAVRLGLLALTPGQRIRCGGERCAVFAGISQAGTVYAVHYVPGQGYNWPKFHALRDTLQASASQIMDPRQHAQALARFALDYRGRFPDLAATAWRRSKVVATLARELGC